MTVVYWGTYDLLKPRNRIMIKGLRECGIDVIQCHKNVWTGVEDKTQIRSFIPKIKFLIKWLFSYPVLIWRYFFLPKHAAVFVGYFGLLDIFVLWPFAKLRSIPIIFDPFVSTYNTVVEDRRLLSERTPLAVILFWGEKIACALADVVIADTKVHGDYFVEVFGLDPQKVFPIIVGAETEMFLPDENKVREVGENFKILFYGQFSPLHGVKTVLDSAEILKNEKIDWLLIGRGQEAEIISSRLDFLKLSTVTWKEWVPYEALNKLLQTSDVCLGIFGKTAKAQRVVPNKVYQAMAAGCPVITQDSPAIREIFHDESESIKLLKKVSPESLAGAVMEMYKLREENLNKRHFLKYKAMISAKAIGESLLKILERLPND